MYSLFRKLPLTARSAKNDPLELNPRPAETACLSAFFGICFFPNSSSCLSPVVVRLYPALTARLATGLISAPILSMWEAPA